MRVLGIETSCDETAASIVEDGAILHANTVASQIEIHKAYGGVVPEIAARSHIEAIIPVIDETFATARMDWSDIDAIAVTQGAGLGGSLLIGVITAAGLAIGKNKPLYPINHVEGHVYANFITSIAKTSKMNEVIYDELDPSTRPFVLPEKAPEFPLLALIVSGGHTQLVLFEDHFKYQVLGKTYDDAIGEAFDKVAKILGLPYPGGPSVAAEALHGDPLAIKLPKSQIAGDYNFSFSGLKTAVLRAAQAAVGRDYTLPSFELAGMLSEKQKKDFAASFQQVAIETVVDKTIAAFNAFQPRSVVIAGGVASSRELRRQLEARLTIKPTYTDPRLCTDNAAMIATLGCFKAKAGEPAADPYTIEINPNLKMITNC